MSQILMDRESFTRDAHLSPEAEHVVRAGRRLLEIGWEMGAPTAVTESSPPSAAAERFRSLAKVWRNDTAHLSSIHDMVLHPAYQQIVGMGPQAVPLIIAELEREPGHWFWALRAITQEDPVPPEHRGNVAEMVRAWLRWAERRGIRW